MNKIVLALVCFVFLLFGISLNMAQAEKTDEKVEDLIEIQNQQFVEMLDRIEEVEKEVEKVKEKIGTKLPGSWVATAYCDCSKCTPGTGKTASGTPVVQGKTVATDFQSSLVAQELG